MIRRTNREIACTREALLAMIPRCTRLNKDGNNIQEALQAIADYLGKPIEQLQFGPVEAKSQYILQCLLDCVDWLHGDDDNDPFRAAQLVYQNADTPPAPARHVEGIILAKRATSLAKFGEQNHLDGTRDGVVERLLCNTARQECDEAAKAGKVTWFQILQEEFQEAGCAVDEDELVGELADVANVAILWIEAIQRRQWKALHDVQPPAA